MAFFGNGLDWIPLVSQAKSFIQACNGDMEGARKTQENFSKRCPIVSQSRSAIEALMGDMEAARKTQDEFTRLTPIISQVRSAVHATMGDTKGARKVQKDFWNEDQGTAVGVIIGGVGGAVVLPVLGFTATGVAGGSIAAGIQSGIGNVAAGSAFATAQSLAATGTGPILLSGIGSTVVAPITNAIGENVIGKVEYSDSDSDSENENLVSGKKQ